MEDLTIIYLTANKLPENFAKYQRTVLKRAIKGFPLISVSREPMDFGHNLIDSEPKSMSNIYRQMLRAAKIATTPYIAIAEDDCLYHRDHFTFFRPPMDTFAYDQNRLALFTWGEPTYSWRNRKSNCSLIAPRELLIEALEERFQKWPDGTPEDRTGEVGRSMVEKNLGLTLRKSVEVFSRISIIQVNHENASEDRQVRRRKSLGPIKAFDIPFWGKAEDIVQIYEIH